MSSNRKTLNDLLSQFESFSNIGSWVDGDTMIGDGAAIDLVDPYLEEIQISYPDCNDEIAIKAVKSAKAAQEKWMSDFNHFDRSQIMQKIAIAVTEKAETLAQIESITAGKPIRDCRVEVAKVAEMFSYYAGWVDKIHGDVINVPSGHFNYVKREPLGVIFQITPWNAPIFTAGWQIAPAIATGNGVVLKPSEFTPITSILLVKFAEEAGLTKGLVNVIAGRGATIAETIISQKEVRKTVFVGSPATGKIVAETTAKYLKPVILELGGKSANIVFEDANLEDAVKGAQAAIFSASGQSCVAGSRLLLQKSIYDEFVTMLKDGMSQLKLGDPLDESTEIGPIANQAQFMHILKMLGAAKAENAELINQPHQEDKGYFITPTLITNVTNEAQAAQNEIFGPVLTVIPFEDEADAVKIANDHNFGLAGAVWTRDIARGHRMADKVRAGTFWINSYKAIHVSSPFGGSLDSGFGRSSGQDVLMAYTQAKSVWVDMNERSNIAFGYAPNT